MKEIVEGKVFAFGKNIDTDQIYPGRFLEYTEPEEIRQYAMYGADPEFTKKFKEGDLIVASTNFGCGSSREHAAITLKSIGVAAVLAESFGRIFYRNAINLGLPVITCKGIHEFAREGDVLRVNIRTGRIRNETTQQEIQADPFSDYIMHILESGGIKPMIRAQQQAKHAK